MVVLEYSFENFTNLDKKKNGKVQNRTLPSSIEMSYKVKILRQTDFVSAHREHIAIFTLCNCYRCSCTETFLDYSSAVSISLLLFSSSRCIIQTNQFDL